MIMKKTISPLIMFYYKYNNGDLVISERYFEYCPQPGYDGPSCGLCDFQRFSDCRCEMNMI